MAEKIVFQGDFEQLFRSHHLATAGDFFAYTGGLRINKNRNREVIVFTLEAEPGREFFLKRFFDPHLKDLFFNFRNLGRICSQAEFEFENARALSRNGLGAFTTVCFGEVTRRGLEEKSFLVSERLPHQCMTDFIDQHWASLSAAERESLMAQLARTIRRLHDARMSMPDLYIYHIFVRQAVESYEFAFIDLHRMGRHVINPATRVRNLGALFFSLVGEYFDEPVKRSFLQAYAPEKSGAALERLYSRVDRRAGVLANRRKIRPRDMRRLKQGQEGEESIPAFRKDT